MKDKGYDMFFISLDGTQWLNSDMRDGKKLFKKKDINPTDLPPDANLQCTTIPEILVDCDFVSQEWTYTETFINNTTDKEIFHNWLCTELCHRKVLVHQIKIPTISRGVFLLKICENGRES